MRFLVQGIGGRGNGDVDLYLGGHNVVVLSAGQVDRVLDKSIRPDVGDVVEMAHSDDGTEVNVSVFREGSRTCCFAIPLEDARVHAGFVDSALIGIIRRSAEAAAVPVNMVDELIKDIKLEVRQHGQNVVSAATGLAVDKVRTNIIEEGFALSGDALMTVRSAVARYFASQAQPVRT